jgi:TRAP transporter TAXI family solute receptor
MRRTLHLLHRRFVMVSLALVAGLAALPASAQDKAGWPQRLTLVTGPTGGFAYTMGAPWTATVSAAIGLAISPEATSGIPVNFLMLNKKQAEVAIGTSDVAVLGWRGEGYAKGVKLQNARTMMMMVPFVFQLYADARSNINSLKDIDGKSVNPSGASSQTDIVFRAMVPALGLKPGRVTNVSPAQANDLMSDGRLDVSAAAGNVPHPAPSQYEARSQIKLIGFTEDEVKKFLDNNPQLSRMVVPAGTYKGQDKDIITVGSYTMFVADKSVPDSLVYAMVKATYDKKDDLANAYKAFGKLDLKGILESPIPLHPGAVKYFEEKGVKIPDKLKG